MDDFDEVAEAVASWTVLQCPMVTSRLALAGAREDLKWLLLRITLSNRCTIIVPLSWLVGPGILLPVLLFLNVSTLANMTMLRLWSSCGVRVNALKQPAVLLEMMTRLQLALPRCGRNMPIGVPIVCSAARAALDRVKNTPWTSVTFRAEELIVANRLALRSVLISRMTLMSELELTATIEASCTTYVSARSSRVRVVEFRVRLYRVVRLCVLSSVRARWEQVRLLMHLYVSVRPVHEAPLTNNFSNCR